MGNLGRGTGAPLSADMRIRGVAFDLDGTFYPNYRLYLRLIPRYLREYRLLLAFSEVRKKLHHIAREGMNSGAGAPASGSFYENQAVLMADILKADPADIKIRLETLVYRGWEPSFHRIALFPDLTETLSSFRAAGLTMAVLSDFPPLRKLELMGLAGFFDAVLATEATGFLKPHPAPFAALGRAMKLEPAEILYVGNSPGYDAEGALAAGMKAALIRKSLISTGPYRPVPGVFVFSGYRQLKKYVLG